MPHRHALEPTHLSSYSALMGAWGTGNFDNDQACDWAFDLEETGTAAITEAFEAVASADDYLDAGDGTDALAAAEVVAAALGRRGTAELPEEVEAYLATKPTIEPAVVELARRAVERVCAAGSELSELWEDSDSFEEWKGVVADLRARLAA
jgi:hypothetical protein